MTEVWLNKDSLEAWQLYQKTDFKYWLGGGGVLSNGDMSCTIYIQLPKPDKRFRTGKRYVNADIIPCIQKTQGYKGYISMVTEEEYTKIVV